MSWPIFDSQTIKNRMAAAKARGVKLGRPRAAVCKRGHVRNQVGSCKECEAARIKKRYAEMKDSIRARTRELQTSQRRDAGIPIRRKGLDPEKLAINLRRSAKRWRERHPDEANAYARERQACRDQRMPVWADKEKIKSVYKLARHMQRELGTRMAVDHVIPLKGEAVSGLHVHENLQVIPYVENAKKYNSYQCA
jgi:hypothetical protein